MFTLWWGFRLTLPDASFASIDTNPYHALHFLPEEAWGALTLVVIALHLLGLVRRVDLLRRGALLIEVGWWFFLATQAAERMPHGTVDGLFVIIALLAAAGYWEMSYGAT